MKGLELSRKYYETYGKDITEKFADRIAVGLAGEGSECFGYDDELSQDHDFEPAFCIWLTREDYEIFGFELERAYTKLPKSFCGFHRQALSPVGGARHGVMTIDDFYGRFGAYDLLNAPYHSLACATNGEVFHDGLGKFTKIRNSLLYGYPEDIKRKKLAAHLAVMAQSGQYNYNRCIKRGERGASQLAAYEFADNALSVIYLLNNRYRPFYKWVYRGMRELEILSELEDAIVRLTLGENTIELITTKITEEIIAQGISTEKSTDLSANAWNIQNSIKDTDLRNMHIMGGI